ncbi:caspase family protein [Candidatus Halocynthiibacter alkanivorans]|uniref:caspase family protein n=1 Tax=Candidatus Halocynthiibacter alkanivorans TaxID=2267619 RepID=UPI000DF37CAB|nr:caspase family protein [Candidatus Halocynthiibacter alkanivorans]
MTLFRTFATTVFLLVSPLTSEAAGDRIGLVIGMSQYDNIPDLKNTVNDARLISETLDGIGFKVTTLMDAPMAELMDTIDDFSFRSETADLALIYFAGHGVEVEGENFLVPVDADVRSNRDIQRQSVSLSQLLTAVDRARKMRIVILDSCRNNPFGDALARSEPGQGAAQGADNNNGSDLRSSAGGLAVPSPDRGTMVAFAARDGQVALDGEGDNSPFAMALAQTLARPGLEISLMFRQVRDQVLASTYNLQEPYTYGSLTSIPFYLAGPAEGSEAVDIADPSVAWTKIRPDQEVQMAALAQGGDTRSMLGLAYMRLNPEGSRFDPSEALDYLSRAAAAGSPEAQFELAKLYERGIGTAQDPARALALYRAAADQDFADAINDLGFMNYQGLLGLPQDPAKALALFERAADLRHPQAMFNFAALIDDGLIPSKSLEDAAGYLYQALRSGSTDVLNLLSDRPTMFKLETRQALQRRLRDNEFYDGTIDGDFGPGTQRGIRLAYGLTG